MIGQVIGGYEILEVLGRGGMGVVYKALDTSLEKTVAIKALNPGQAQNEQFLGRFRSEARALGRLQHPHIVNVFAFRHVEPHLFIVMEYVDGGSVADLIARRGAVPWQEALPLITQSLESIVYAHEANVIHRDIKPRNILLTKRGRVKITDFGLAKIQDASADSGGLTRTGFTGGTLYYMPPEQLQGLHKVDHRSDIYSFGMTCYELLAGRVPFDKSSAEFSILKAIDSHSFPPLAEAAQNVPAPLVEIVTKALEHDQDDRYQRASDMLDAIEQWSAGAETMAPSPSQMATRVLPRAYKPGDDTASRTEKNEASKGDSGSWLRALRALVDPGKRSREGSAPMREASDTGGIGVAPPPVEAKTVVERPMPKQTVADRPAVPSEPVARPVPAAATEDAGRKRPVALILGALLLLAVLAFVLTRGGEAPEPVPSMASLSLETDPPNATIYVNGERIGTTPLAAYEVAAGESQIRIERPGFAAVDTTVFLVAETTPTFSFAMAQAGAAPTDEGPGEIEVPDELAADDEPGEVQADLGAVVVQSSPSGAEVWRGGRRLGTTPYTARGLQPGPVDFVLRRPGYAEATASARVRAGTETRTSATLTQLRGTLRVLVRPYGDIYVNGDVKARATNAPYTDELPAGTYRVRAVHPALGTWEKNVTLGGNAREEVLFNFNTTYRLLVISTPSNAEIVVDGEPTGRFTPSQVTLRPGRHTIAVRKEGYVMDGAARTLTIEQDRTGTPMSFELSPR